MKNELANGVKEESGAVKQHSVKFELMEVEKPTQSADIKQDKDVKPAEQEELLGSVIRPRHPGLRSSARFIKKVKREEEPIPITPANGREPSAASGRLLQKTAQVRIKCLWTNLERNHFFDALHEFGKDYESIGNYINGKLKRRCSSDVCFKTKDQVRQHYYQTFHKLCKYMRFSDEVKKPVQELYALINYGEMRRKLQFVPDKHLMKLKHLVYQGHTTVRFKGKNIRIKTPSCKTLRRINHLDDSLDDIKLPAKIDVILSPFTMEAFGRVQCVAQNPRVRTTVPLNKKLMNFIKTFQHKWRSAEAKLAEEEAKMNAANQASEKDNCDNKDEPVISAPVILPPPQLRDGEICFVTKPNVTVHRPLLSITAFLSSGNICLSAYEERMGVKVRGETLLMEKFAHVNQCKRMRTSSDCDKRSPEMKKYKNVQIANIVKEVNGIEPKEVAEVKEETVESSGDEDLSDEINELLADPENKETKEDNLDTQPTSVPTTNVEQKKEEIKENNKQNKVRLIELPVVDLPPDVPEPKPPATKRSVAAAKTNNKPLLDEETIKRINEGWTLSTAGDITVGDLYVVLGTEGRLELQYYWKDPSEWSPTKVTYASATEKQTALPYNPQETENPEYAKDVINSNSVSNRLKHLLLIANLSDRMRRKPCSCGHVCDRINNRSRTYVSPKVFAHNANGMNGMHEGGIFRQPLVPARRPLCHMDPVKQLNTFQFSKSQKLARQVLVQRMLIPATGNQVQEVQQPPVVGASMPSLDMDFEEIVEPKPKISNNIIESKVSQPVTNKTASIPTITTTTTTTTTPIAVVAAATTPINAQDLNQNTFAGSFLSEKHSFNQECHKVEPINITSNQQKPANGLEETLNNIDSLSVHTIDENSTSSSKFF